MNLTPEEHEDLRVALADYKNTGNPDLLRKLRDYIFKCQDYEGDDEVINDLKATFHF